MRNVVGCWSMGPVESFDRHDWTAPRDARALLRRLQLKLRDARVDGVVLLLRATAQTRRFIAEAGALLAADFPVPGDRALALLRGGLEPGGNAVVVLPRRSMR